MLKNYLIVLLRTILRQRGYSFINICGLALVISCLGLLGLASYSVEQRTREVGIRKVLGASIPEIAAGFCREFAICVAVANLVAGPLSYVAMSHWLESFAYRTAIEWTAFAQAVAMTLAVALLTVSWHTIRAARANPVESLRSE